MSRTHIAMATALTLLATGLSAQTRMTRDEYIRKYKSIAIEHQEIYGIPASITLAQGLLESDNGNSRLVKEGNNHFGIKCKSNWKGDVIYHDDDAANECFRGYASAEESYEDHAKFLDTSPRYQSLFDLAPTDYKGWAHGLKKAGYATNPKYAELLIKIIEENDLHLLDVGAEWKHKSQTTAKAREAAGKLLEASRSAEEGRVDVDNYTVAVHKIAGYSIYSNNGSEFIVAADGDDLATLARKLDIPRKRLLRYNDLGPAGSVSAGDKVYIHNKNSRVENGRRSHSVRDGETLQSISQDYGVKVKRLAKLNHRRTTDPVHSGEQLRLQ